MVHRLVNNAHSVRPCYRLIFLIHRMSHSKKYKKLFIQQTVPIFCLQAPEADLFEFKKKLKPSYSKLSRRELLV